MKFIRCYLLIIVLIFLCGCGSALRVYLHPQTDIGGIKKVAVVPFSNLSADHFAGERVTNAFITELLIRTNVEIVEEGELVKGLKEIGIDHGSGVNLEKSLDVAKLQKLGKSLGAQGIVLGSVDQYDMVRIGAESYPVITLTVRLLDVETGGIMWMSSFSKKGGPGSIPFISAGEVYTLSELTQKVARQIVSSLGE
ncbi:MAG: hypothetical protein HYY56_04170 [Candidatus Omnitrophica bacterium]|nr:hypothetical protein [Candidatus Omnitrophota bacterium]